MAPEGKESNATSPESGGGGTEPAAECNGIAGASGGGGPKCSPIDGGEIPEVVRDADRTVDVAVGADKVRDLPSDPERGEAVAAVAAGDLNGVSNGDGAIGEVVEIPVEKGEIDGGSRGGERGDGELSVEMARENGGDRGKEKPVSSSSDEAVGIGGEGETVGKDANGGDVREKAPVEVAESGGRSGGGEGGDGQLSVEITRENGGDWGKEKPISSSSDEAVGIGGEGETVGKDANGGDVREKATVEVAESGGRSGGGEGGDGQLTVEIARENGGDRGKEKPISSSSDEAVGIGGEGKTVGKDANSGDVREKATLEVAESGGRYGSQGAENGSVEGGGDVDIGGREHVELVNRAEETVESRVEAGENASRAREDLEEEVGGVAGGGEETLLVQDGNETEAVVLESSAEEEKTSIPVHGGEGAGSAGRDEPVESCQGASSGLVGESDVDAVCLESLRVESMDDEEPKSGAPDDNLEVSAEGGSQNASSSPMVDVHVEVREGEALVGGEPSEVNAPSHDERPGVDSAEMRTDDVHETGEGVEVKGPSHDERPEVESAEERTDGVHETGESVEVKGPSSHDERPEVESAEERTDGVHETGEGVEVCASGDLEQQNKVESTSAEPEEPASCDAKSENIKAEVEDGVARDAENETSNGKEERTLSPEIREAASPDVKARREVTREIDLEEGNAVAPANQDKSRSEDDDEKPAGNEDAAAAAEGMRQDGAAPPNTEEPVGSVSELRVYMVRVPRVQDEKLSAEILRAEACLEERTQRRDSIRMKIRETMTSFEEHKKNINDARNEERAAREAFYSKQQEVNAIHSTADKIEIANSIDNVDDQVQYLSHRMQHETISLKEEKQLMREIKELKQKRDHLSKLTPQTEMQKAFDQKDQIDDNLKRLRPELEHLRKGLLKCEAKTKAARKKYDEECKIVEDLRGQYKVADDLRQDAYMKMKALRKQLYEKNKHFYKYKDDMRAANTHSLSGDRKALGNHCNDQIESFMELWNKSNEFRNQYVQANQNSIIRRFRTLDGRSLAPDEQPATLPKTTVKKPESSAEAASRNDPVPMKRKQDKSSKPPEPEAVSETSNKIENGNNSSRAKKLTRSSPQTSPLLDISNEESKADEEERERRKAAAAELKRSADELARKEELGKEQAAAELKEKIRLEQIAKAREAEERKRRKAEKAKLAAEMRARKEAELKEKKRAKKERQKENKAASSTDVGDGTAVAVQSIPYSASEAVEVPETNVAPEPKMRSRASQAVKQQFKKINPLPPPLRNRRRRKLQTWIWVLLVIAAVILLFLVGGYVSSSRITSPQFGF